MIHIKAPNNFYNISDNFTIFLGGSIEMGTASMWQNCLAADLEYQDIVILNPRRDDWDNSLPQDPTPGSVFSNQVMWETAAQQYADLLVYYFDDATISAITLLELGEFGSLEPAPVVVCCPPSYFRYANVKLFCDRHHITLVATYQELLAFIKESIKNANI